MAADRRITAQSRDRHLEQVLPRPNGFAVELDQVSKAYGRQSVLSEISLAAAEGECIALLGPNGAGKTTLFKLMLGLTRPDSGAVQIAGVNPSERAFRSLRGGIGFLPENVSFYDAMTGREVLSFYARLKDVPAKQCAELLERVGLTDAASRRVATYSKGMRQRLGLAQALLGRPRLLILDEPTTGLDAALRKSLFGILRNFKDAGVTIFISSHALTEIEARADRYAILQDGNLAAIGSLSDLQQESMLPVKIRLQVPPGKIKALRKVVGAAADLFMTPDGRVELACRPDRKVGLIRKILASGVPVEDIDLRSTSLEDIYAYFSNRRIDE